jgi:pantetheine-phosphate adenylyltransferase
MRIGLYPGTFDPITLGISTSSGRACALVDRLVIGVAINRDKGPLFTLEERVAMIEAECAGFPSRPAPRSWRIRSRTC